MARKLTQEQKDKMQAARKEAAEARKNNETVAGASAALPVFKAGKAKNPTVKIGKIRISRTTPVTGIQAAVDEAVAAMRAAGLNPSRIGGTLRVY